MLNYTSRPGDVLTMAHELGHGVHAALARPKGMFEFTTPLTVAETASIFGETIVLERLLDDAPDAPARLSLLAESLDGAVAAVFRQIAMNQFEHRIHTERRESGELSTDAFAAAWADTQADLLGDSVEPSEDYSSWWSYVPHFVSTPGYVYAYAYGHLLALSVYRRFEEEGPGFAPAYLDMLRAGGSMPPEELGQIVGVDLADPGFWSSGLDLIERQLDLAEKAAEEAGAGGGGSPPRGGGGGGGVGAQPASETISAHGRCSAWRPGGAGLLARAGGAPGDDAAGRPRRHGAEGRAPRGRRRHTGLGPTRAADGTATYFLSVNRGKHSVALDLADASPAVARELAEGADVVVHNFRPGTMERLGMDHATLSAANPGLISCTVTGFGAGPAPPCPATTCCFRRSAA